ncbi:MAG: bifunctional methylenetetrahydrofolate dehydrogenase/methenyltetrahydrofolate cyclohydrolase [Coxiella sp. RIFCSPHIGHO2_12_FULL_42_15]|nr:MAG: bifunctional methylenetetrahydrofolate dehydrogenase/methenyltetrahydrofolate cyclohydrolase [Coxiella sp. RIFCSPHIGHO2_12_FULL_42_15]
MNAKILDGQALSSLIKQKVKTEVNRRLQQHLATPGLHVILVGNDPASHVYVQHKQNACKQTGIFSKLHHLPENTRQAELFRLIEQLNADIHVHGILLQVPLPPHLDSSRLLEAISPAKDVDGFHPYNMGCLALRVPKLRPCTPYGIIQLLEHYHIPCQGKRAVIVGASNIVGRPMALELLLKKATVTVCHQFTTDLEKEVRNAEILVSAIGKINVIQSKWIASEAVVIDAGITRLTDNKIVGDIDFDSAKKHTSWITPVPGGVGPMTVATLLQNTLQAASA